MSGTGTTRGMANILPDLPTAGPGSRLNEQLHTVYPPTGQPLPTPRLNGRHLGQMIIGVGYRIPASQPAIEKCMQFLRPGS
jgi:hypothetical protein